MTVSALITELTKLNCPDATVRIVYGDIEKGDCFDREDFHVLPDKTGKDAIVELYVLKKLVERGVSVN